MGAAGRLSTADLFHLYRQGYLSIRVHVPSALQTLYHTQRIEEVEADTVAEVVIVLNERYPGIHDRLMEPDGSLRRYVNVFVEQEDGRWPGKADTQLENGKQVWIVPNIAGGATRGGPTPGDALPDYAAPRNDTRGGATL
jgi:molybdopterin synthase sulfur carrier subunit